MIVNGIDPCAQIVDLQYVIAANPYQPLFSLSDGMTIQQIPQQVSIMAVPVCPTVNIESFDLTITGPELNWTILQNVAPFTVFDNYGTDFNGRNFIPGTYMVTVTGYAQDNRGGGIIYGPVVTTFTVVGSMATISAPTLSTPAICAGGNVDVSFSTSGSFDSGNQFQIQLSDVNGNFVNPTIIGTSSSAGTVACQIPLSAVGGNHYLVRVASSNQVLAGNPTMSFISVKPSVKTLVADISTGISIEEASTKITATNKIIAPAQVTYQAGNAIVLNPGFQASAGTVFKAEIQGCTNN